MYLHQEDDVEMIDENIKMSKIKKQFMSKFKVGLMQKQEKFITKDMN